MGEPPISGRPGPDRKPESKQTRVGRGAGRGCAERGARGPGWPLPPARSPHGRRGVPGEAALAVVAPLAHGEHAGVGRAGEEEVAHVEGSQRAESPALARAAEALQAAAGLGAHAGGAAAARCGARASPREGGSEGGSAATAGLQGTWALRSLGAGAEPWPRPGAAGGREGWAWVHRVRAGGNPRAPTRLNPGNCSLGKTRVRRRLDRHPLCQPSAACVRRFKIQAATAGGE